MYDLHGSIPHPMQSLCTLRNRRQRPGNTRYQADATPYLGRTCTGWIAPACGWRTYAITSSAREHGRRHVEPERLGGLDADFADKARTQKVDTGRTNHLP